MLSTILSMDDGQVAGDPLLQSLLTPSEEVLNDDAKRVAIWNMLRNILLRTAALPLPRRRANLPPLDPYRMVFQYFSALLATPCGPTRWCAPVFEWVVLFLRDVRLDPTSPLFANITSAPLARRAALMQASDGVALMITLLVECMRVAASAAASVAHDASHAQTPCVPSVSELVEMLLHFCEGADTPQRRKSTAENTIAGSGASLAPMAEAAENLPPLPQLDWVLCHIGGLFPHATLRAYVANIFQRHPALRAPAAALLADAWHGGAYIQDGEEERRGARSRAADAPSPPLAAEYPALRFLLSAPHTDGAPFTGAHSEWAAAADAICSAHPDAASALIVSLARTWARAVDALMSPAPLQESSAAHGRMHTPRAPEGAVPALGVEASLRGSFGPRSRHAAVFAALTGLFAALLRAAPAALRLAISTATTTAGATDRGESHTFVKGRMGTSGPEKEPRAGASTAGAEADTLMSKHGERMLAAIKLLADCRSYGKCATGFLRFSPRFFVVRLFLFGLCCTHAPRTHLAAISSALGFQRFAAPLRFVPFVPVCSARARVCGVHHCRCVPHRFAWPCCAVATSSGPLRTPRQCLLCALAREPRARSPWGDKPDLANGPGW